MHDALLIGHCFHDVLLILCLLFPIHAAAFHMIFSGTPCVQVRTLDYQDVRPVKDLATGGLLIHSRLQQTIRDG